MFQFFLQKIWYRENFFKYLFMPLSWAFHVCLILRKKAYQIGLFKIYKAKCPVVVIGNITVGGTGKTPSTIKIYKILQKHFSKNIAYIGCILFLINPNSLISSSQIMTESISTTLFFLSFYFPFCFKQHLLTTMTMRVMKKTS